MQLIGQKVQHQVFGTGVVTARNEGTLTVQFEAGEKMFLYPDAFTNFLVLQNQDMQGKMQGALHERELEEQERERIAEEKWRKEANLRTMKISTRAQAVLDIPSQELDDVFSRWTVSTGTYASGYSKGEPRVPDRMKANSLCIITTRPEGQPESMRKITGAFMVPDTFEGDRCLDGVIEAHEEYRIHLDDRHQLLYWPFVTEQPSKQKWGNTRMKYVPNTVGEAVLSKMCSLTMDETEKKNLQEMHGYFCRINRIQPTKP